MPIRFGGGPLQLFILISILRDKYIYASFEVQ